MDIAFWHGLQHGPVLDTFNKIVHEWNMTHLDYQVKTQEYSVFDAPAREGLAKPDHEQPNLVLAPEYMTGTMMTALGKKQVIPINQFLSNEKLARIAALVSRTFGDAKGNLVSLPFNPSCGVLFANGDLVQKMPETLEELEEICLQLIKEGKCEKGFTCAWPAGYLVELPAAQQDIALATPENGKLGYGEFRLASEWLWKHLLDIRKMQQSGVFVYAGQTNDARKPFVEKKAAFFMQGAAHYPILQKEADFPVIASHLPSLLRGHEAKYSCPLGGAAIWVLDNSQTQKMLAGVKDFLNYLSSEEIQERWHKETGCVPVLQSLPAKLEEFYRDHPIHKAVVTQTIEAVLGQHSFGVHMPNYGVARKEIFNLIEKVLDSNTTDEQVMEILKEFDAKYSIAPPLAAQPIAQGTFASFFKGLLAAVPCLK